MNIQLNLGSFLALFDILLGFVDLVKAFEDAANFFWVGNTNLLVEPLLFIHALHSEVDLRNFLDFFNKLHINRIFRFVSLHNELEELFSQKRFVLINFFVDLVALSVDEFFLFFHDDGLNFVALEH